MKNNKFNGGPLFASSVCLGVFISIIGLIISNNGGISIFASIMYLFGFFLLFISNKKENKEFYLIYVSIVIFFFIVGSLVCFIWGIYLSSFLIPVGSIIILLIITIIILTTNTETLTLQQAINDINKKKTNYTINNIEVEHNGLSKTYKID